jgi:hypothetical protein
VSGRSKGTPDVEPQLTAALTVPPTAPERLAALEAERDRERAAIQELEADLRTAAGGRPVMDAAERFRRTVALAFGLAAAIVGGLIALLFGLRQ